MVRAYDLSNFFTENWICAKTFPKSAYFKHNDRLRYYKLQIAAHKLANDLKIKLEMVPRS